MERAAFSWFGGFYQSQTRKPCGAVQGLQTLAAKMPKMLRWQARFFTTRPGALRWLMGACVAVASLAGSWAQSPPAAGGSPGQGPSVQVQQSLWLDETQTLEFESVRTQVFQPFKPAARLTLGPGVLWVRLNVQQADGAVGPLFLQLLPPHIGEVTLYSPSGPGRWDQRLLGSHEVLSRVKLGGMATTEDFYLRIASRNSPALVALVGRQDDLDSHETKLAVAITVITTLTLVFLLVMLWRTVSHASWMAALISTLMLSSQTQLWLSLGYAYTVLGLPLKVGTALAPPLTIANLAIAGSIFSLFYTALFPHQRWVRWLWAWSVLQTVLCLYALIEPDTASNLSTMAWRIGPLMFGASLLMAAIREPDRLRQISSKVAFGILLLISTVMAFVAWRAGGFWGATSTELASDLFITNLVSRVSLLLVITGFANWLFERLKAAQLHAIQGELQVSKESLDLESKRLERQRKFTAMLAHELKNPLAVSHLALSGIKARIAKDDPLLERSAAIEQSLQEIDAIIDRCSEMDGFEQGQLPMSLGSFTLNDLTAAIKAANPSERIYLLMRGVPGDTVLVSDIQYLKIIFSNLLTNALKYSPPDTLVELAVRPASQTGPTPAVEFCISNEVGNAGTPAPDLAFERFYRAEAARNQSGAGLGLWLSQSLAHALGSEVVMQTDPEKISFSLVLKYT